MALYAIGDLHLSLGADKPMDVFGGAWEGYVDKLRESLSHLKPEDTLLLLGDTSWGMSLAQAKADFDFLRQVPGRKILLKGNHDYWWDTVGKMTRFLGEMGTSDFAFLHNNCVLFGDTALCGTRGWFFEEDRPGDAQNQKIFRRELMRLEASLRAGAESGAKYLLCALHYPPLYEGYRCAPILELLRKYGVRRCLYGHLHGPGILKAFQGREYGVEFTLLSADAVDFCPQKILESGEIPLVFSK